MSHLKLLVRELTAGLLQGRAGNTPELPYSAAVYRMPVPKGSRSRHFRVNIFSLCQIVQHRLVLFGPRRGEGQARPGIPHVRLDFYRRLQRNQRCGISLLPDQAGAVRGQNVGILRVFRQQASVNLRGFGRVSVLIGNVGQQFSQARRYRAPPYRPFPVPPEPRGLCRCWRVRFPVALRAP